MGVSTIKRPEDSAPPVGEKEGSWTRKGTNAYLPLYACIKFYLMLVLSIAGQEMPTFPRMWTNVNIAPDMFFIFFIR